jgi:glycosyltransferase involved in cell wall biosynthesis
LLIHLGDDPLFDITIPSKTQYCLATGRPIVAAVSGETAELLRESEAAIVVPPADPDALACAIIEMANKSSSEREWMGSAGAQFYDRNLSFSRGMDRTLALIDGTYQAVAAGQQSR